MAHSSVICGYFSFNASTISATYMSTLLGLWPVKTQVFMVNLLCVCSTPRGVEKTRKHCAGIKCPTQCHLNHTEAIHSILRNARESCIIIPKVRDRILLCRRHNRLRRLWGAPTPHSCRVVLASPKNNLIICFVRHLIPGAFYSLT